MLSGAKKSMLSLGVACGLIFGVAAPASALESYYTTADLSCESTPSIYGFIKVTFYSSGSTTLKMSGATVATFPSGFSGTYYSTVSSFTSMKIEAAGSLDYVSRGCYNPNIG